MNPFLVAIAPLLVVITGWASPSQTPAAPPTSASASPSPGSPRCPLPWRTPLPAYSGLSEQEAVARARAAQVAFRVVCRDGRYLPLTADINLGRVNAVLERGRVVEAAGE